MIEVKLVCHVGVFAENKDIARDLRTKTILPALQEGEVVMLDFARVEGVTQSFVHALLSDLLRQYGREVLDKIVFKNCGDEVRKIIAIVVDYMQEIDK